MTAEPTPIVARLLAQRLQTLERDHAELAGAVAELRATLCELSDAIGRPPSAHDPGGSGVAGLMGEIAITLGRAPNDATGETGSGLSRVVAELARREQRSTTQMVRASVVGATGAAALIELVLRLLEALA